MPKKIWFESAEQCKRQISNKSLPNALNIILRVIQNHVLSVHPSKSPNHEKKIRQKIDVDHFSTEDLQMRQVFIKFGALSNKHLIEFEPGFKNRV